LNVRSFCPSLLSVGITGVTSMLSLWFAFFNYFPIILAWGPPAIGLDTEVSQTCQDGPHLGSGKQGEASSLATPSSSLLLPPACCLFGPVEQSPWLTPSFTQGHTELRCHLFWEPVPRALKLQPRLPMPNMPPQTNARTVSPPHRAVGWVPYFLTLSVLSEFLSQLWRGLG
jgi:hypothetical protein